MQRSTTAMPAYGSAITILVLLTAEVLQYALIYNEKWYWCLFVTVPLIILIYFFSRYRRVKAR